MRGYLRTNMFQQLLTQEIESGWYVQFHYDKEKDRYEVKMTKNHDTTTGILYGQGSNIERAFMNAINKRIIK